MTKLLHEIKLRECTLIQHCWNKMCLTLPLESFDDNKVLKIVN